MSKILNGFEINYEGKDYILLIDLQDNKLKIKCLNNLSGDFFSSKAYKTENLHSMNKCFRFTNNIEEIQTLLNNSIEKGKIGLLEDFEQITIFFNLISGDDEIIIGFSLMKQKIAKKNKSIRESKNLIDNKKIGIDIISKENCIKNQNELILTEQIKKLNEETEKLKNEIKLLKNENDLLRKENVELKDYKKKFEIIMMTPSPLKKDTESEGKLKLSDDINEDKNKDNIININKTEKGKENEKLNLYEQNFEYDNNMNIIYNDNYENESENDKEINELSNKNNIDENIQLSEKENLNNTNLDNKTEQISYEKENSNKENNDIVSNEKIKDIENDDFKPDLENQNKMEEDEKVNVSNTSLKIEEDEEKSDNKQIEKIENKEEHILTQKDEEKDEDKKLEVNEDYEEEEIEYIENNEIINNKQNDILQEKNDLNLDEKIEANEEKNDIFSKENDINENNNEIKINNESKTNEINNEKIEIKTKENINDQIKENENISNNKENINIEDNILSMEELILETNKNIQTNINFVENNIFEKETNSRNEVENINEENIIAESEANNKKEVENINEENKIAESEANNKKEIKNINEGNKIVENEAKRKKEEENINLEKNKNEEEQRGKETINQIDIIDKDKDKEKLKDFEEENKKIEIQNIIEKSSSIKKEEIIKDKKEKVEEINLDIREIEDKEIELEKNIKKLITNNAENDLKSSFNSISNQDNNGEHDKSKYFYNDKINPNFKTKKLIKKDSFSSNKNKSYNFEKESPMKNSCQSIERNKGVLKGEIFHDSKELDFISKNIHKNKYKINLNLIYKASFDGDKSSIFHEKCDKAQTTIVLVETKNNERFGGCTKRTWRGSNIDKIDNDSFIFSLNKREIYNVMKGKKVIGSYNEIGPYFLGAFKIFDDALSKGGCLLRNEKNYEIKDIHELMDEDKFSNLKGNNLETKFEVKEIEVYEIKIA